MHSGKFPRRLHALAACCLLFCFTASVTGEEAVLRSAERQLNERGSLTLREVTLSQALFTISETWKVNLLFGNSIEGNVNGVFRDATLREVLDSVLLANGYGYRPKGQSLIIMSLEELGDSNAMLETISVPLTGPVTEDIIKAAELMLSPQGKLQPVVSLGKVMIRDFPENTRRIQALFQSAQQSNLMPHAGQASPPTASDTIRILNPQPPLPPVADRTVIYLTPRHTQASTLQEPLQSFLSEATKVVAIATENRLVIVGSREELALAERIFIELDRPREQVRITALIYDVNIEELERLGVNWTHNVKAGINSAGVARQTLGGKFGPFPDPAASAFTIGDAVDAAASSSTIGAARLTTLNRYLDLDAIVSALDSTDGARLLADPSVTVLDREEASIKIVTEIPIQQLTQTSEGGSIGTTSFREAGVTLTVTPQIGGDGTITMAVTPTFSVLTGFSEGQPIIDSREASTKVRVADRQTLVIGGLRQRSENENVSGIPGVMKWKHFGKLFRSHSSTIQESELIVFLRPEITTPTSLGTPRQAAALCVTQERLARTNWPTTLPVVPNCNDPHCPYHNPRSRFIDPAGRPYPYSHAGNNSLMTPDPRLQTPSTTVRLPHPDVQAGHADRKPTLNNPFSGADTSGRMMSPDHGRPVTPYDVSPVRPEASGVPAQSSEPAPFYPTEFEPQSSDSEQTFAPGQPSPEQNPPEEFGFITPVSHSVIRELSQEEDDRKSPSEASRFRWKWPAWYRPISSRFGRSK